MPAPLAKGIIIGVSVLIAASFAIYESPQFQRWVNQSRRKIAVALYSLGDEIHPREPPSQDISMTEEPGQDAQERRKRAREEIEERRAVMRSRRDTRSSSTAISFDDMVDKDGNLRPKDGSDAVHDAADGDNNIENATAQSTALDSSFSAALHRRGGSQDPEGLTNARLQAQREMMEAMERDRLHLYLPSETSSQHPSESLIDLTPKSEFPEANEEVPANHSSTPSVHGQMANTEYFSIPSLPSAATQNPEVDQSESEYFYAHPNQSDHSYTDVNSPENPFQDHDVSTASSVPGSFDHIRDEISSDGTLSEWGHPTEEGILTPASWSEVGSVISSDDEHHHQ